MKRIQHSSKAQQYSYIVKERTQLQLRRMGPLKFLQLKIKHHFCDTKYPEDMKYPGEIPLVAILMGIILIPLLGVALIFAAVMGGIRLLIRFYEISYWIQRIKIDRTRYSLVNNGGIIEKTILPEDQAKLDKKQKRAERLQQLKEKRLSKRTLAKN